MTAEPTEFQQILSQIGIAGLVSGAIAIGKRLNLFKALSEVSSEESPATPAEVALKADCKERYVKEWLCMMATADIIEVNKEEKFWIKEEHVNDLVNANTSTMFSTCLPCFVGGIPRLTNVMKKAGPLGLEYTDFEEFYDVMENFSVLKTENQLVDQYLPLLDKDLKTRLSDERMMVLDVGCGSGFHSALMAEAFPNSNFTGIDVTLKAVLAANQKRHDDGRTFDNLAFLQMDASKMDADWNDKYDVVLIFDACHDQMRPDLCLKEIHRVLKPGGIFAMIEPLGSSNVHTDKETLGAMATITYGCSLYHCLPVASNSEDALGLGAAWGSEAAVKLLKDSGFEDVEVIHSPALRFNQLYLCKK